VPLRRRLNTTTNERKNEMTAYGLMKHEDYQALDNVARSLSASGYFKDAATAAQAFAKVLAGAERA
jgi:hypothetical protein